MPDPAALEFSGRVACISAIADAIVSYARAYRVYAEIHGD